MFLNIAKNIGPSVDGCVSKISNFFKSQIVVAKQKSNCKNNGNRCFRGPDQRLLPGYKTLIFLQYLHGNCKNKWPRH